jgi:iron-sulfur cluster assembly protein
MRTSTAPIIACRRGVTRAPETTSELLDPRLTAPEERLLAWAARPESTRREVSALLALTDDAVDAVRNIVSSSDELSENGGLRLAAERSGTQTSLQLSVVALPGEDDEVIEEQGARVFLEPEAAAVLDDKVLDARIEQNQVEFTIADQTEE